MDLLVDEQEKEYEFLCQAPLHQHLQVHSLPHAHDRLNECAAEAHPNKPIGEDIRTYELDLLHRSVNDPENNRDESDESAHIYHFSSPEEDNHHVEEGL